MSDLQRHPGCDWGQGSPVQIRPSRLVTKFTNHADKTGCRYGLIRPQPQVAKILQISRLDQRMPVFATMNDALTQLPAPTRASA